MVLSGLLVLFELNLVPRSLDVVGPSDVCLMVGSVLSVAYWR